MIGEEVKFDQSLQDGRILLFVRLAETLITLITLSLDATWNQLLQESLK